jgi:hypothetical protein
MKTPAIRTQKEAFVELITVTQLIKVPYSLINDAHGGPFHREQGVADH